MRQSFKEFCEVLIELGLDLNYVVLGMHISRVKHVLLLGAIDFICNLGIFADRTQDIVPLGISS